ncbi:MAG: penicillin acylase family protein [Desulfobacteraceae bacterium]|nr:MAG: penicillin acylase family protein [Desulfobacteraceae bacterium]
MTQRPNKGFVGLIGFVEFVEFAGLVVLLGLAFDSTFGEIKKRKKQIARTVQLLTTPIQRDVVMKWLKRAALGLAGLLVVIGLAMVVLINPFGASPLNDYLKEGELNLAGLKQPVRICRDEKGMAFIYAADLQDLLFAQGFVTATDRLFQMELTKLLAAGRIGELIGAQGRDIDARMRTLGFHRYAQRHLQVLNEETRTYLQHYADGINAMISTRPQDIHLEFKLAGIRPTLWSPVDSLTILYFMGWNNAANVQNEIVSQMLVEKLGAARAAQLFPLNLNPDEGAQSALATPAQVAALGDGHLRRLLAFAENRPLQVGSNNWVVGSGRAAGAKPILANDPHLDAAMLPGPWYPCGLITPSFRAVGVSIPGTPAIVIGRTDHLAFGITNAYGDTQDLYVETVDPDDPRRYLEGDRSLPFEVIEETLRFKDKAAPDGFTTEEIRIRATRRGPVVSDVLVPLGRDKVITVRWSAFETMGPSIGLERFLTCRTAQQFRRALQDVRQICLNYVFADQEGHIGWQVTGVLPIRSNGAGNLPHVVQDDQDNWRGWIPFDQMPHAADPPGGWVGTSNHKTVTRDYPYYYSDYFSSAYRQQRMIALMSDAAPRTAQAHWEYQRDIVNLKAAQIAPRMASALLKHPDSAPLGTILAAWNHVESADQPGPTLFHAIFNEFARLVIADDLGDEPARFMLANTYYWEQRLVAMIAAGESAWFDDVRTADTIENQDALWQRAGLNAAARLAADWGTDPSKWQWGKIHRYDFISPIARKGPAKRWLGGGTHPAEGSGDTLLRAKSEYKDLTNINVMASLRMVVDLGDPDKVLAVLPGGVTGRQFDPHTTDQIEPFINGKEVHWWFSDQAIEEHTRHVLVLKP